MSERAAGGPPAAFALLQNRPNPFVLATGIDFELPRASRVRVDIYDMQGRLVRGLADRPFEAGRWSLAWDRRSDDGQPMPPAVYFYRMTAGGFRGQRKMVMLP